MEVNLWNFSIVQLILCRPLLWASAARFAYGAASIFLEGYGADNPASKSQGIKQLVAGGGVALIGMTLVPLLSGLLG